MTQDTHKTPRYIAFLRAINVGSHIVKMARLRALFEELGLSKVETFIASGNVIFHTPESDLQALEQQIEGHLRQALGYDVATFIRSSAEVATVATYESFPDNDRAAAGNILYIAFLRTPPPREAQDRLMTFRNTVDDFHVHGREVYWLSRKTIGASTFSGAVLEKTLAMPATIRNSTTVKRITAKYPAS